jgi:amino-acid N-acetyltransferase
MLLRKARMHDVEGMNKLIDYYAGQGLMLPRNLNTLYQNIRDYVLVEIDGEIKGIGGLHVFWHDLAEIRSLAVTPDLVKKSIGGKIVNYFLQEAKEMGLKKVFTLTYQPVFFEKIGFTRINKEELPQKVWQECIHCIKFPNCDEIALIINV